MFITKRNLLVTGATLAALFGAGAVMAQERMAMPMDMKGCPCSNPVNVQIVKNSSPTPLASDFAPQYAGKPPVAYNDNGIDHYFRDTLYWKIPTKTCELKGTITWTVVNNRGNGIQYNDTSWAMLNGAAIPGMGGPVGSLPTGGTKTFGPYNLSSAQIHSGHISVGLQDDSAMKDIRVSITGCCITPN
jgi:hypothetical protein